MEINKPVAVKMEINKPVPVKKRQNKAIVWNHEAVLGLISMVEENKAFWDPRETLYSNKLYRQRFLEQVQDELKGLLNFEVTPSQINSKWQSLKSYFSSCCAKYQKCTRSGVDAEEVEDLTLDPAWDYYKHLTFLREKMAVTPSVNSFNLQNIKVLETPPDDYEVIADFDSPVYTPPSSSRSSTSPAAKRFASARVSFSPDDVAADSSLNYFLGRPTDASTKSLVPSSPTTKSQSSFVPSPSPSTVDNSQTGASRAAFVQSPSTSTAHTSESSSIDSFVSRGTGFFRFPSPLTFDQSNSSSKDSFVSHMTAPRKGSIPGPSTTTSERKFPSIQPHTHTRKRQTKQTSDGTNQDVVFADISSRLMDRLDKKKTPEPIPTSKYYNYGLHIAQELEDLDDQLANDVMHTINTALYEAKKSRV